MRADLQPADPFFALRSEFRRAALDTNDQRDRVVLRWFGFGLYMLLIAGVSLLSQTKLIGRWQALAPIAQVGAVLGVAGWGMATWVTARTRETHRRALRAKLAALPPDRQAELLFPLCDDPTPGLPLLVRPLVRELRLPAELMPAVGPTARGDEAVPSLERRDA